MPRANLKPIPALCAALLLLAGAGTTRAASFNLFYDSFDDFIVNPADIVGLGTFSYDGPIDEGVFLLSDLTGVSYHVEFTGQNGTGVFSGPPFDPADDSLIGISVFEAGPGVFELVFFGESAGTGGSLDIDNGDGLLSHEPVTLLLDAIGPLLYFADDFNADFSYFGDYIGTTANLIPVPPALYLFGSALAALALRRRAG
ncbi:MAG: hypothetical protein HKO62_08605 [Gammaproteobacteria bacterium]|nr:hypothetical protein [Gammaproteobacteria bacterium]